MEENRNEAADNSEKVLPGKDAGSYYINSVKKKSKKKKEKKPKTFGGKLALLWEDKRRFSNRLITALCASFAFVFTFFAFGPLEIYLSNMSFFAFSTKYLMLPLIVAAVLIFALVSGILLLLRGKIFNYAVSLVSSVTLAGYIQGNFLNIDHGSLDGEAVNWQKFKTGAFLSLLFWVIMIIIPLAVQYFKGKIWKNAVRVISLILTGAQLTALIVILSNTREYSDVSDDGFYSREGIYEVAPKNNVVLFLLDRFDNKYADMLLEREPELEKKFGGFTYYTDYTGSYSRTCPSVTYFLTGVKCDYQIPMQDYFKKAWKEGKFIPALKDAGYGVKIYSDVSYTMMHSSYGEGLVDNMGHPTHTVDYSKILSAMYGLSVYRYAPEYVKPYYHIYTGDISFGYIYGDKGSRNNIYSIDDVLFRKNLMKEKVTVDDDSKGEFIFYHLLGSHDPYVMDENGEKVTARMTKENMLKQTRGNIGTLLEYIEMLKRDGVYDDTTIIVTADHGRTGGVKELLPTDDTGYIDNAGERLLSLFIKPAGANTNEPLKRSGKQICMDNLRASIVSYFGLETEEFGDTIEKIGEDEERTRYFWMNSKYKGCRDWSIITYRIKGNGNDFGNWEKIDELESKYPFYDAGKKK